MLKVYNNTKTGQYAVQNSKGTYLIADNGEDFTSTTLEEISSFSECKASEIDVPEQLLEECEECYNGIVEGVCTFCNGSGEGSYDGSRCCSCGGSGTEYYKCECGKADKA